MKFVKTIKTLVSPLPDTTQSSSPKEPKSDTAISPVAKSGFQMEMTDTVKRDIKQQAAYYALKKQDGFYLSPKFYSFIKERVIRDNSEERVDEMNADDMAMWMKTIPFASDTERQKFFATCMLCPFKPEYANETFAKEVYWQIVKTNLVATGEALLYVAIYGTVLFGGIALIAWIVENH